MLNAGFPFRRSSVPSGGPAGAGLAILVTGLLSAAAFGDGVPTRKDKKLWDGSPACLAPDFPERTGMIPYISLPQSESARIPFADGNSVKLYEVAADGTETERTDRHQSDLIADEHYAAVPRGTSIRIVGHTDGTELPLYPTGTELIHRIRLRDAARTILEIRYSRRLEDGTWAFALYDRQPRPDCASRGELARREDNLLTARSVPFVHTQLGSLRLKYMPIPANSCRACHAGHVGVGEGRKETGPCAFREPRNADDYHTSLDAWGEASHAVHREFTEDPERDQKRHREEDGVVLPDYARFKCTAFDDLKAGRLVELVVPGTSAHPQARLAFKIETSETEDLLVARPIEPDYQSLVLRLTRGDHNFIHEELRVVDADHPESFDGILSETLPWVYCQAEYHPPKLDLDRVDGMFHDPQQLRWSLHGTENVFGVAASGTQGGRSFVAPNHLMADFSKKLGPKLVVGGRAMGTFDIFAARNGIIQPLQSGELCSPLGRECLGAQHPHGPLVELTGRIGRDLGMGDSVYLIAGPIGQASVGAPSMYERESAKYNPNVELMHHLATLWHRVPSVVKVQLNLNGTTAEAGVYRHPDDNPYSLKMGLGAPDSGGVRIFHTWGADKPSGGQAGVSLGWEKPGAGESATGAYERSQVAWWSTHRTIGRAYLSATSIFGATTQAFESRTLRGFCEEFVLSLQRFGFFGRVEFRQVAPGQLSIVVTDGNTGAQWIKAITIGAYHDLFPKRLERVTGDHLKIKAVGSYTRSAAPDLADWRRALGGRTFNSVTIGLQFTFGFGRGHGTH